MRETRANLRRWAIVLRSFGKERWAEAIERVASRAVVRTKVGSKGQNLIPSLISEREVTDCIEEAFGPGFIDSPYMWDVQGEQAVWCNLFEH